MSLHGPSPGGRTWAGGCCSGVGAVAVSLGGPTGAGCLVICYLAVVWGLCLLGFGFFLVLSMSRSERCRSLCPLPRAGCSLLTCSGPREWGRSHRSWALSLFTRGQAVTEGEEACGPGASIW